MKNKVLIPARGKNRLGISQSGLVLYPHTQCCHAPADAIETSPRAELAIGTTYYCRGCRAEILDRRARRSRSYMSDFPLVYLAPATSLQVGNTHAMARWISAWTGLEDVEVQVSC